MSQLDIEKRVGAVLLSGFILAGSGIGFMKASAVSSNKCELKSTPIETTLEDEETLSITTIDEELAKENIDIVNLDNEFREHAKELTYDNYVNDRSWYEENLIWLKQNYVKTASSILFAAGKGAIADELEVNMNSITLYPAFAEDDSVNHAVVRKSLTEEDTYKVKSKNLNKLINKVDNLEYDVEDMKHGKDIAKEYDNVINIANSVIQGGISRKDNQLEEKFSKKYIKQKSNK